MEERVCLEIRRLSENRISERLSLQQQELRSLTIYEWNPLSGVVKVMF